jgi:predicted nucleic acid-binding protein
MFLIDTDVAVALRRADRADPRLLAWAKATPVSSIYLSSISLLEIEMGVWLAKQQDETRWGSLLEWQTMQLLPQFEDRILPIDTSVAQCCAWIWAQQRRQGRSVLTTYRYLQIASTAMVHKMTIVTRNTADFEPTGVELLNPWLWG